MLASSLFAFSRASGHFHVAKIWSKNEAMDKNVGIALLVLARLRPGPER
jgi:hypothetical protein